MAGCCSKTLTAFSRLLLVFACTFWLISRLFQLWAPEQAGAKQKDESFAGVFVVYLVQGFFLAVPLIGLHATWTRESRHIKSFAVCLLVLAFLSAFGMYRDYSNRDHDERFLITTLTLSKEDYVWYKPDANPPTAIWDDLQEGWECCGLLNGTEWAKSRPSKLAKDVLPSSCCSANARAFSLDDKCHAKDAFEVGCLEQFRLRQNIVLIVMSMRILYYFTLIMVALGISKPGLSAEHASGCYAHQYNRFEGSVYVRQPGAHDINQKPPAYASAPPPNYGMA